MEQKKYSNRKTISNKDKIFITIIILIFSSIYKLTTAQNFEDSLLSKIDFFVKQGDSLNIGNAFYKIAKYNFENGNDIDALKNLKKSLIYLHDSNKLKSLNLTGTVYWSKSNYEKALDYYLKTKEFADNINNYKYQAIALNNIGFVYEDYNKIETSLEYYEAALEIRKKILDSLGIGLSLNSIGKIYYELDSMDISMNYFNQSIDFFIKCKYQKGESNVLNNIGNVFIKKEMYDSALYYHFSALEIRKSIDNYLLIMESYKNISRTQILKEDYFAALENIKIGMEIARKTDSKKITKELYYQLYELYLNLFDYKKALNNYIKYTEIKDSIYTVESLDKIQKLEIEYQTEKKENQINILSIENNYKQKIIEKQHDNFVILIFASLGIFIFSLVILIIYFQRNSAYKMLVKKNIEIVKNDCVRKKISNTINNEEEIIKALENEILKNKYYLNSNINIDDLAKQINTNRQYLSKIINDNYNMNFNNYINQFRITEASKLLLNKSYNKYTIDAIGEICGFNNRTTFISAFKKFTGVTPAFFKNNKHSV